MKTKNLVFIIMGLFLSVLFSATIFSCKTKGSDEVYIDSSKVQVGSVKDVPAFFLNPPVSDNKIYGVGAAKMKKIDASRQAAVTKARNDIALQVDAQIRSAISEYYQESGADEGDQMISFYEIVSKQLTDTTLRGTTVEEVIPSKNGTLYALVSFPKENILKEAENVFSRNEDAAFAEFKAQDALKSLETRLNDNPTQAGQAKQGE